MKVKLNKPTMVRCLSGEVEVTQQEYERLLLLGAIDTEARQTPEIKTKQTRKAK